MEKQKTTEEKTNESYEPPDELPQEDFDEDYIEWYHNHNQGS